jgi:hypothetical protein
MATKKKIQKTEEKNIVMAKVNANDTVTFKASELNKFTKNDPIVAKYPELYDERVEFKPNEYLAKSLQEDGQIHNLLVTLAPVSDTEMVPYIVVGNQRQSAAFSISPDFELKATLIPFDVKSIVFKRITENENRFNTSTVAKAKSIAKLRTVKDSEGNELYSVADLANRYGLSPVQIYNYVAVAELLSLNIPGLKAAVDIGQVKMTTLVSFTKGEFRGEDGKLKKELISEAFYAAMKLGEGGNGKMTGRSANRAIGNSKEKPKSDEIRKLISYNEVPYAVQLVVHWIFGDNTPEKTVELASANGIDMSWFPRALAQTVEKKHNEKGAGRKKKASAESELLA